MNDKFKEIAFNKNNLEIYEKVRTSNYERVIYRTPDGIGTIWEINDCTPGFGEYTTDIIYPKDKHNPYYIEDANTFNWQLKTVVREDNEDYEG